MNIPFKHIGATLQEFSLAHDNAEFTGTLERHGRSTVLLKGHLGGSLEVQCDLCGKAFDTPLDEEVVFLISEGVLEGGDETYDVVEVEGSVIDMDEIFHSEIELIRSDYHRCEKC